MPHPLTASELEQIGLVAIVRTDKPTDLRQVAQALMEGGIRAMEITLNTPGALPAIGAIRKELGPHLRVGAGTILDSDDARAAMDVGAEFIVTPTLQTDSIAVCRERGVPIFCGCMTPTECLAAHRAGADFIKLFPADTLGPTYMRALRGPLPFLKLVPTGGVSLENLSDFIQAGCVGVGLGGNLVSRAILASEDWNALAHSSRQFVDSLASARAKWKEGKA